MRRLVCLGLLLAACKKDSAPRSGIELVYGGPGLTPEVAATVTRRLTGLGAEGVATLEDGKLKVRVSGAQLPAVKANLSTGGRLEFFGVDDNLSKRLCGAARPEGVNLEKENLTDGSLTCYFTGAEGPVRAAAKAALGDAVRLGRLKGDTVRSYLVFPPAFLTGKSVVEAKPFAASADHPQAGVSLVFDDAGKELFADHTEKLRDMRLAIVVDDWVESAPVVMGRIAGGRAMLTTGATGDPQSLAAALSAGQLPPLTLERETKY